MPVYKSATPKEGGIVVLPAGIYLALVTAAKEGKSKSNNPKIELTIALYKYDRKDKKALKTGAKVWDNLVFTEAAFWKIDQFRAATGETFEAGLDTEISAEWCVHRKGWVKVGIEQREQGKYAGEDQNAIETWLLEYNPNEGGDEPAATTPTTSTTDTAPDDIPF